MPPNQSPLAGLFNLFKGSSSSPPSLPRGGMPGFGSPPGRIGGFPGPRGGLGGGGFSGFGGPPGGGGGMPGLGGSANSGGGLFGLGNIAKNLSKVDIGKVMDGVNNFRNMMANAQKVATTLNQLGITVGNVQKFMKQVDINGLMNLLGSGESGGSEDMGLDSSTSEESSSANKKQSVKRKRTNKNKTRKRGTKKRSATGKAKQRKPNKSTPLLKKR